MASAVSPFLQMASATSALRFASMSRSATFAPSDASRSAYARPMPCAAPVTTTALSASRADIPSPLTRGSCASRLAIGVRAALALAHRRVAQVTPDQHRDAAVVAREQRCGALGVALADRGEELLVMLGCVLQRGPAQRARDLLAQARDELHQARSSGDRVQTVVETLARRELRVGRLGPRDLRVQVIELAQVLLGHERDREADGVALE